MTIEQLFMIMREDKMEKIVLIGALPKDKDDIGGEIIKNEILLKFLKKNNFSVNVINTRHWKTAKFSLFSKIFFNLLSHKKIILSASTKNALKLMKFFNILGLFRKRDFFYFVIGGTLIKEIEKNHNNLRSLKRCKKIFIETKGMNDCLAEFGLKNSSVLPNFKNYNFIPDKKFQDKTNPVKLFFFSRVCKEKGIEIAISTAKELGESYPIVFDIYGPIEKGYETRFKELIKDVKGISYKGILKANSNETYKILSDYDLMLFPTFHNGEGFPGAIIDAYIAGVPVLASDWKYNHEIIVQNKTGWLFDLSIENDFKVKLDNLIANRCFYGSSTFCVEEARKYHIKNIKIEGLI